MNVNKPNTTIKIYFLTAFDTCLQLISKTQTLMYQKVL